MIHKFVPGQGSGLTLLLLHGTGGDENDLLPIGRAVAPGAALLSPRGSVLENGAPRFFRRLSPGVFDEADIRVRARELAEFVAGFSLDRVVALGYSNGANIAAAVMLLYPEVLSGAVLMRPMTPLIPDPLPVLAEKRILILAGNQDPMTTPENADSLAKLLSRCGAVVEVQWHEAGHDLTPSDFNSAKTFLVEFEGRGVRS